MKKYFLASLALFAAPVVASAQFDNLKDLIENLGDVVNIATPVIVGIALIAFFWGLAKFIFSAGDEEKRESGKSIMIWGIVALFVIVSIWGIVRWLGEALDVDEGGEIDVPRVGDLN